MTVKLDTFARHTLWREATLRLTALDDIPSALRNGDGREARNLRDGLAADMRLLDDLGWEEGTPPYLLTMQEDDLAALMWQYVVEADDDLRDRAPSYDADERIAQIDDALDLRFVATQVLEALGRAHRD